MVLLASLTSASVAGTPVATHRPWMNTSLNAGERTRLLLESMTATDKFRLVFGFYSNEAPWKSYHKPPEGVRQSAGYVPGNARLGIPALTETDAGIGVASQAGPHPSLATALPSNLAIAASWDPELAFSGGQMIGDEARRLGFNVMLAGGINLAREPRGGRTFEYAGEDPWLAANLVSAQIRGIQSNHIIATTKHFALNDQETGRMTISARIDERAARMSDLLAFELAIGQSQPGAVMCAYNRINGVWSCENPWLLTGVLREDWGYKGFVMSDWGATHSTIPAANAGLDQESGYPFDRAAYFGDALKEAIAGGHVPLSRLDAMASHILYSMFVNGLFDEPVGGDLPDFEAHARIARVSAEGSMVLLKNDRAILPLAADLPSIAVIGSHADVGVLSGGGSSQVYPQTGVAVVDTDIKHGFAVYFRSSPVDALIARTHAKVLYNDGTDPVAAAQLAARCKVAVVFARQWRAEGVDATLDLDADQDSLIEAVAKANANTIVVLETGGPVLMPWLNSVASVLEAWYPGSSGGEAIARVLTGEVNPSGRLPLTFPRSAEQLPRPAGFPATQETDQTEALVAYPTVDYGIEGAAVGYKWYDKRSLSPLFPFGFGLSYSQFTYTGLRAEAIDNGIVVHFRVKNTGRVTGAEVAQIYVGPKEWSAEGLWEAPRRLAGFVKLNLRPGESRRVSVSIEPRLTGFYDDDLHGWRIAAGEYEVRLSKDATQAVAQGLVHLDAQSLPQH